MERLRQTSGGIVVEIHSRVRKKCTEQELDYTSRPIFSAVARVNGLAIMATAIRRSEFITQSVGVRFIANLRL